jgi:hypothetical protein
MAMNVRIGRFTPVVTWTSLSGRALDGLSVTFNETTEGVVRTEIYFDTGRTLRKVYEDPVGVCRPAALRDVDANGRYELVTVENSVGDCRDECHEDLEARFEIIPGWVGVLRWTGSEWKRADQEFPWFYRQLAANLQVALQWVEAVGTSGACSDTSNDGSVRRFLNTLISRAQAIASSLPG